MSGYTLDHRILRTGGDDRPKHLTDRSCLAEEKSIRRALGGVCGGSITRQCQQGIPATCTTTCSRPSTASMMKLPFETCPAETDPDAVVGSWVRLTGRRWLGACHHSCRCNAHDGNACWVAVGSNAQGQSSCVVDQEEVPMMYRVSFSSLHHVCTCDMR